MGPVDKMAITAEAWKSAWETRVSLGLACQPQRKCTQKRESVKRFWGIPEELVRFKRILCGDRKKIYSTRGHLLAHWLFLSADFFARLSSA